MPHVMTAGKRRHDHVGHAEPKLRAKALMPGGGSISRMRARTGGTQIAMVGKNTRGRRLAGQEAVRIHRDRRNVTFQARQRALVFWFVWPGTGGT